MALCLVAVAEQRGCAVFRQAEGLIRKRRRLRVIVCGAALALSATLVAGPVSAAPRPPNPTDAQINAAKAAKDRTAFLVGRLSALVAQATARIHDLSAKVELAEQRYALAVSRLNAAKDDAVKAQAAVVAAQKSVDKARRNLTTFVRTTYMSPTIASSTGGLLTAKDPNALLQRGDYIQYVSDRHLDAMGALDRATVAKSNADAKAKALVQLQQKLTEEAAAAQKAAQEALRQQKAQQAELQAQQISYQRQLSAAQFQLATLNGQRKKFQAWQREQARIAAEKARLAREALLRAQQEAAAEAARLRNASGGQPDSSPLPPSGSMGGWTAGKGQAAVNRAMRWLGTPYAWAGGNYNGPTYGVNSPGTDGWNDSSVYGFDCSGLMLYAWAPQGLYMEHFAATQFTQAGSYHPGPGNFMPGDLLFWGLPGQYDIHHVAMYIGNGNVIQAPYSGSYVQVTPWGQVSGDYFGATRPLT
jgi:cell wall-associated NlpC family hydrolase